MATHFNVKQQENFMDLNYKIYKSNKKGKKSNKLLFIIMLYKINIYNRMGIDKKRFFK